MRLKGRLFGRPGPVLGTLMPSSTTLNALLSWVWPAESAADKGRPFPSAHRCSLVLSPPRLLPNASSSGGPINQVDMDLCPSGGRSPFLLSSARRVLVRPDRRRIQRAVEPDDVAFFFPSLLKLGEYLLPGPILLPARKPPLRRRLGTVPLRQILPRSACSQYPDDAV